MLGGQSKRIKRCAVVYGGGKDGHLALLSAIRQGFKISCLIMCDAGKTHHIFFHDLKKTKIIREHAKLLKIKLLVLKIPLSIQKASLKTIIVKCLKSALKKYQFDTVFIGNTEDFEEAKVWEEVGKELKIKIKLPLKNKNIFQIIDICEKNEISPLIVGVEKNVDKRWLGKIMNKDVKDYIIQERKKGNYLDGNDFQTLVIKSPLFKKEMKIIKSKIFSYDTLTYFKIIKFKFV